MMTKREYTFLITGEDKGAFEYCRCFGWCSGLSLEGHAVLTKHGVKAIKAFENNA